MFKIFLSLWDFIGSIRLKKAGLILNFVIANKHIRKHLMPKYCHKSVTMQSIYYLQEIEVQIIFFSDKRLFFYLNKYLFFNLTQITFIVDFKA